MLFDFTCKNLFVHENNGNGGSVIIHSPPVSEVGSSNPGPYVGKVVVAYQWPGVYSKELGPTIYTGFICSQDYLS